MKNEYLSRTATFTAKNIDKLFEEAGTELVARSDVDLVDTITLATASRLMHEAVSHEVFGETTQRSATLRGEDFSVRATIALDRIASIAMASHTDRDDDVDSVARVFNVVGACTYLKAMVEDKLFGSDHVEEHKSVNSEKEDTDA